MCEWHFFGPDPAFFDKDIEVSLGYCILYSKWQAGYYLAIDD